MRYSEAKSADNIAFEAEADKCIVMLQLLLVSLESNIHCTTRLFCCHYQAEDRTDNYWGPGAVSSIALMKKQISHFLKSFSPNRPLGRFGLVVTMCMYISVCLSPFCVIFFFVSVD